MSRKTFSNIIRYITLPKKQRQKNNAKQEEDLKEVWKQYFMISPQEADKAISNDRHRSTNSKDKYMKFWKVLREGCAAKLGKTRYEI